jgi:hypothetical protein
MSLPEIFIILKSVLNLKKNKDKKKPSLEGFSIKDKN